MTGITTDVLRHRLADYQLSRPLHDKVIIKLRPSPTSVPITYPSSLSAHDPTTQYTLSDRLPIRLASPHITIPHPSPPRLISPKIACQPIYASLSFEEKCTPTSTTFNLFCLHLQLLSLVSKCTWVLSHYTALMQKSTGEILQRVI